MTQLTGIIAITDRGWYEFLRDQTELDEVNFWKPSAHRAVRAAPFAPFLFKLKSPANAICGFGYFARYSRLPPWLAWEAFGAGNGCETYEEMTDRIGRIRHRIRYRVEDGPNAIGCVLIAAPILFARDHWVQQPRDWPIRTQSEKRYDLTKGEGARVWRECLQSASESSTREETAVAESHARYGDPVLVRPRLGQGIFRIAVTEAYEGACAMTGEHSLPALEASHIKPFNQGGLHETRNGLLLRADLHRLYDKGYLTVTPDARIEVSARLKEDYRNGRTYYPLHGAELRLPRNREEYPSRKHLEWHNEHVFVV